jgi:hypothetical protein
MDGIRNVPKKWFDASLAIDEPNLFAYPSPPCPYPGSVFAAWLIPDPASELSIREGATLLSANNSSFCLTLSGLVVVARSGKKMDRRPSNSIVE